MKFFFLFFVNVATVCLSQVYAQEVVCTGGGEARGGGTISYTIGQTFYADIESIHGYITSGVQQTYVVEEVKTAVSDIAFDADVEVFPNPTIDNLTLHLYGNLNSNLNYILIDSNGRQMQQSVVTDNFTAIDVHSLFPSVYYLQLYCGSNRVKVFKIVKIK